ncbi:MAG: DNA polymerase III subunit gamma/tau [Sulfurospirillaceae bacterium]|nr:DNA polymerase III subunit gamma/tau [Sulfurospirillaceae bacterium]MDD2827583.1 DNA polymerase III subunit gamma/tau [Sulfurospirillaceae bacterium]
MSHQVLALKYRPSSFDKLIGQESITQTLTLALSQDRLSHAYLFSGLRGSGKTSTARIFAKALLCESGPTATPCELCSHCLSANENRHIDIIEMDAASNRGIDDIRDLIENTKYKPNSARFKVFIIDEVHMLTAQAFNALLKTLEEPPPYVKFILATTDPLKLPATILSRTQHFRFKQIKTSDVVNHLCHILNLENVEYEKEALEMLSRAGNGSLRDTLTLLDQAIIYSKGYITPQIIAAMLGLLDPNQLETIFSAILNGDKAALLSIIKELESYECEVVIDELIAYLKNAFFEQDRRFSTLLYERFFKILSESKQLLFINANNGFVLSLLLFKMVEATHIKTIEEMIDSLESEKFRIPTPVQSKTVQTAESPSILHDNKNIPTHGKFQKLIEKLYDRNIELGKSFESSTHFISYEENLLMLESSATDEVSKKLNTHYGIIKHFIHDIYGLETKIKIIKSAKEERSTHLVSESAELHANEESSSMVEDEMSQQEGSNTESCVAGHITAEKREVDAKEILNDPFIQRAQELFDPRKITIHPKV